MFLHRRLLGSFAISLPPVIIQPFLSNSVPFDSKVFAPKNGKSCRQNKVVQAVLDKIRGKVLHFCEQSVIIACNDSYYQKVHLLIVFYFPLPRSERRRR